MGQAETGSAGDRKPDRNLDVSSEASLLVQGGSRHGEVIALFSEITTMGRQPDNDVVVDEPPVSRKHSAIVSTVNGYYIRDLGSTNGTFINRRRIFDDEFSLMHGDLVRMGGSDITFMFQFSGAKTVRISSVEPPLDALVVDAKARQVYVRGQRLDPALPRKEFDLLQLLNSRRGEAVSRDEIARHVWAERSDGDVGNHEIEQCVHRVRVRVEENTSKPEHLMTIRGFGYKLD